MANETKFTSDMLPRNRREVFVDVLRQHWGRFLSFGLLVLIFALPLNSMAIYSDMYLGKMYASVGDSSDKDALVKLAAQLTAFDNFRYLCDIPLYMIFAVCLAGLARVVRQYAWEENVSFRHDFGLGIKQNVKQYLLFAFMFGVVRFGCHYLDNLLGATSVKWLAVVPTAVCTVLLVPTCAYAVVGCSVYENSFVRNLRVGFRCYARHPWKSLLATVGGLAIFLLQNDVWGYLFDMSTVMTIHIIGRIVGCAAVPFIMLAFWLFAYNVFDETINVAEHTELVGKGTFAAEN